MEYLGLNAKGGATAGQAKGEQAASDKQQKSMVQRMARGLGKKVGIIAKQG